MSACNWKPNNDSHDFRRQFYNVQNMLNMVYIDYDYVFRMGERRHTSGFGAQWMYQESSGHSLIRGSNGSQRL